MSQQWNDQRFRSLLLLVHKPLFGLLVGYPFNCFVNELVVVRFHFTCISSNIPIEESELRIL